MNVRFPGYLASALLLACCGGCAASRLPADLFDDQHEIVAPDPSFQPGMEYLTITNDTPDGSWQRADDWVLLGVKVSHHGRDDVWFVRISTHSPPASDSPRFKPFVVPLNIGSLKARTLLIAPVGRVCVEVFDENGAFVHTSIRQVPMGSPSASLLDLCKHISVERPGSEEIGRTPEQTEALEALMIMLHSIGNSRSLQVIRDATRSDVIEMPSLLSVVISGFKFKVEMDLRHGTWRGGMPAMLSSAPCDEARFQLRIAGQPMFNGRLVCRAPQPPFHLTAGMLILEAVHPHNPQNRFMLRVLAAKHN
jgi:hypothetical protein